MMREETQPALRCNVCGGRQITCFHRVYDVTLGDDDTAYGLYRCDDCGFVFIDPTQVQTGRDYYGDSYYSFATFGKSKIDKCEKSTTRSGQCKCILDVGCGSGAWLYRRKVDGHKVWGLEVDERAAAVGREAGLIIVQDMDELPDARFDFIRMSHVLEHTPEPMAMMFQLRPKLKPGGKVEILVPNVDSVKFVRTLDISKLLDVPRHFVFFSAETLRILLESADLAIDRIDWVPAPSFYREFAGDLRRLLVYWAKAKPGLGRIIEILLQAILIRVYAPSRAGRANDWIIAEAHRPIEIDAGAEVDAEK